MRSPAAATSRSQRLRPHQRHVAVQHQHQRIVRHARHRLRDRVTGAQLLGLQRPSQRVLVQCLAHPLAAVTVDDVDVRRAHRARGVDDVGQQRASRQRLQHLGQIGLHPLALAGSEDHDAERHLLDPLRAKRVDCTGASTRGRRTAVQRACAPLSDGSCAASGWPATAPIWPRARLPRSRFPASPCARGRPLPPPALPPAPWPRRGPQHGSPCLKAR